jgi:adenylate cyclase
MPHLIREGSEGLSSDPDGARTRLLAGTTILGRASKCDVCIPDTSLSREHARFDVGPDGTFVTDMGSRNGTSVDGLAVTSARLKNGSLLRCGNVIFRFEDDPVEVTSSAGAYEDSLRELLDVGPAHEGTIRIKTASPEQRARKKLDILLAVSRILSSPEPIEKVLERVFDLLFQIFDIDRAALLLADEATGELAPRLSRAKRGDVDPATPIYSRQIVESAFAGQGGVISSDATLDPRFMEAGSVRITGIRSSMCVPLPSRTRTLGVLYVDHLSGSNRYGPEDLEFLAGFGAQAAVAIENGRLYARLEEEAVRRTSLLRFFPPSLVGPLLSSAGSGLETMDSNVTVLFSDISGFTSLSSQLTSREVVGLLNRYFPVMAEIVFRYEGTLEKYIGDALMAIWGAPIPRPDDADRAVAAAVEMQAAITRLNASRPNYSPLAIHIGLNSGPVTFGNIGSADYVQFAAIGDTTNVSSRICNVASPGEIVASGSTVACLTPGRWNLAALPPATVKGKDRPVNVYLVRGPSGTRPPARPVGEGLDQTASLR